MLKMFGMFLAVALVAGMSQAATFMWGQTGGANNAAGDDYAAIGTVYNLIYLGTTDPGVTEATTYDYTTGLTDVGGTIVGTHTYTETEWNGGGFAAVYDAPESTINGYYMVTMYDAATPDVFDSVIFQMSGLTETGSGGDAAALINAGNLGKEMHGTVVPELFSTALLMLGAAVVGLRRKQA